VALAHCFSFHAFWKSFPLLLDFTYEIRVIYDPCDVRTSTWRCSRISRCPKILMSIAFSPITNLCVRDPNEVIPRSFHRNWQLLATLLFGCVRIGHMNMTNQKNEAKFLEELGSRPFFVAF
jgi:hypothetical protein